VVFGAKVSSGNGVRMEPISNLRMFLSANELLGCITKLRSSSRRLKPQSAWYLTTERESSTLGVLEPSALFERRGKTFTIVISGESEERITWKHFGLCNVGETKCKDMRKAKNQSAKVSKEIYTIDHRKGV
jgi:hypothetical protein